MVGLQIVAKGRSEAKKVTALKIDLMGTTDPAAVKAVRVLSSRGEINAGAGVVFGELAPNGKAICILHSEHPKRSLEHDDQSF